MKIDFKSRVVRSKAPVSAPVEDELVLANVDTAKYYAFNNIATAIWNGIEKEVTVEDLCLHLQKFYDVPAERCENEVLEFVNKMHVKGLVDVV
ncbi:PqqD family protein [bacterium]|nr:PqqD family protein [bacterium]